MDEYERLVSAIKRVDLVLCCVDNYEARMAVNKVSNHLINRQARDGR